MGNWAKVWLTASLLGMVLVLSACGKDNGQDSVQANTAPPRNCWNGQCSWGTGSSSNFPRQWMPYPRYPNGAYDHSRGCMIYGANFQPYNDFNNGLICIPYDTNAQWQQFSQPSGFSGYYSQGCNPSLQSSTYYPDGRLNPCPGRCFGTWRMNSYWGNSWNNPAYSQYGVCQ